MKRILAFATVALMSASVSYGDAVTNTVKWNVPWGDRYRERSIETLDAYEVEINSLAAGTGQDDVTVNNATVRTNLVVGGATTTATARVTGSAVIEDDLTVNTDASVGGTLKVTGTISNTVLTAGLPVFTDAGKALVSGTTGAALTSATVAITPQAPGAVTPTITVTSETGAVIAEGANNLVTATITVTIFTVIGYDSTGAAITNAAGESVLFMTNATATCSPNLASNAVAIVTVTGGDAVMTNATATCSALPDFATNAIAVVTPVTDTFAKP